MLKIARAVGRVLVRPRRPPCVFRLTWMRIAFKNTSKDRIGQSFGIAAVAG